MEDLGISRQEHEINLRARLRRQRTMVNVRSAIASRFGSASDWFLDQDSAGAVQAIGPHGLFRDGLHFSPEISEEQAKAVVTQAQRWIQQQQDYPPGI